MIHLQVAHGINADTFHVTASTPRQNADSNQEEVIQLETVDQNTEPEPNNDLEASNGDEGEYIGEASRKNMNRKRKIRTDSESEIEDGE